MSGRVEGKVALVTGAASGLGKAAAHMLAREGARVVVTDRNEAAGREVATALGDRGLFVKLDVTREEDWAHAMERTLSHFERLDVLVNNVHPTFIDTPMVEDLTRRTGDPVAGRAHLVKQIPLGRLGEPDDVAYAIVYQASEESKLMTGSELVLDGGSTAQ